LAGKPNHVNVLLRVCLFELQTTKTLVSKIKTGNPRRGSRSSTYSYKISKEFKEFFLHCTFCFEKLEIKSYFLWERRSAHATHIGETFARNTFAK